MKLEIDEQILTSILQGTHTGLQMTGLAPQAVGASKLPAAEGTVLVMVGLVGRDSGSVTLAVRDRAAMLMAGRLVGEEHTTLNEDVLDAMMEIGNMIAGSTKNHLQQRGFDISAISVPSLIVGGGHNVYYTRGLRTVCALFELDEIPITHNRDRIFATTVSLMRKIGKV
jgi:CheY-specific phosphatase CheX